MIEVESVDVSLGDTEILRDVSLRVPAGEFVGLVGPNGAGKTTLLRTVNGAIDPDAGRVLVDGDRMDDLSSRAGSRRVATVPQDTGTRFAFSVADVVAMGRTPHRSRFGSDGDGDDAVERALERTSTASFRDRRISTLSGGERQRVFVARAIAQEAPALVLDEPTASLDVNHATRTLSLVRELVESGRAVLGAIHDLEAAARFCDRLVMLADGEVVASGEPADVLTADALATSFDMESVVTRNPVTGTPTVTPLSDTGDEERSVHVLGGGRVGAAVVARLHAAGFAVTAGPVPEGDELLGVSERLDVPTETVPPMSALDGSTLAAAGERIDESDVTVLADLTLTPDGGLLDLAAEAGRTVVVEERPLDERDRAGRDQRRRYERLRERATTSELDDVTATVRSVEADAGRHVSRRGI
ncbi:ATP-binding cassette domain-containing protein [Halomicrobium sp. IBSBa]|uniref:ATP-binding cassette domain-containing protein n=1 Tax=Halomicrobium sp. IBSBa TaxID=2778916 RepID=UPI001ABF2C04|nr:ATP-binding cassette domain-containing protein [Halomicrobium sp. IBSBa]MBO4246603.1 ATP-binding cassette domain-containing protein [Halomicrobium sp. IBSBa]